MIRKYRYIYLALILIDVIFLLIAYLSTHNLGILEPTGLIAQQQKRLIFTAIGLMLIVVIPAYFLFFRTAWKYGVGRGNSYDPESEEAPVKQYLWWAFPALIVFLLAITTWGATHRLDPYKPIESNVQPIKIQVVALNWKWLFIYPDQRIATVNFVQFPVNTPVDLELTADAPMNSFWIPQLGGQMYAMAGMSSQLHLMAVKTGDFSGFANEINGKGFAGMRFTARSSDPQRFTDWVNMVKKSPNILNFGTYTRLAQPSQDSPVFYYSFTEKNLYDKIIGKYMPSGMTDSYIEDTHPDGGLRPIDQTDEPLNEPGGVHIY